MFGNAKNNLIDDLDKSTFLIFYSKCCGLSLILYSNTILQRLCIAKGVFWHKIWVNSRNNHFVCGMDKFAFPTIIKYYSFGASQSRQKRGSIKKVFLRPELMTNCFRPCSILRNRHNFEKKSQNERITSFYH